MMNQKMDRGSDACKAHLANSSEMEIRQTRRGCLQEILGCEGTSLYGSVCMQRRYNEHVYN